LLHLIAYNDKYYTKTRLQAVKYFFKKISNIPIPCILIYSYKTRASTSWRRMTQALIFTIAKPMSSIFPIFHEKPQICKNRDIWSNPRDVSSRIRISISAFPQVTLKVFIFQWTAGVSWDRGRSHGSAGSHVYARDPMAGQQIFRT